MSDRNPLIIPDRDTSPYRHCPKCGSNKITGTGRDGTAYFTCLEESCKNQWQGGLARLPEDPRIPKPPLNPKDKPLSEFYPIYKDNQLVDWQEEVRRQDLTPDFKKGAPIGEDDDGFGY